MPVAFRDSTTVVIQHQFFFAFEHMCINAQCCYYFICWQVPSASVMTIVKEVDPPTTRTTANTTLTRNLFSTDTSNLAVGLNSSQEPIWPSAKTRSQKKKLQV